jgi:hypothetical protein
MVVSAPETVDSLPAMDEAQMNASSPQMWTAQSHEARQQLQLSQLIKQSSNQGSQAFIARQHAPARMSPQNQWTSHSPSKLDDSAAEMFSCDAASNGSLGLEYDGEQQTRGSLDGLNRMRMEESFTQMGQGPLQQISAGQQPLPRQSGQQQEQQHRQQQAQHGQAAAASLTQQQQQQMLHQQMVQQQQRQMMQQQTCQLQHLKTMQYMPLGNQDMPFVQQDAPQPLPPAKGHPGKGRNAGHRSRNTNEDLRKMQVTSGWGHATDYGPLPHYMSPLVEDTTAATLAISTRTGNYSNAGYADTGSSKWKDTGQRASYNNMRREKKASADYSSNLGFNYEFNHGKGEAMPGGKGEHFQKFGRRQDGAHIEDNSNEHNKNTMKTQLEALRLEAPLSVLTVRQINKLGLSSPLLLRSHFSNYGRVKDVLVAHSYVKYNTAGRRLHEHRRVRAAGMGFVVMCSPEDAARVLSEGLEQVVNGWTVKIEPFHRHNVGKQIGSEGSLQELGPTTTSTMTELTDLTESDSDGVEEKKTVSPPQVVRDAVYKGSPGSRERWHSPGSDNSNSS